MERDDRSDVESCAICGEDVYAGDPTSYALADATVICYACARRRGGIFHAELEAWTTPPEISRMHTPSGMYARGE